MIFVNDVGRLCKNLAFNLKIGSDKVCFRMKPCLSVLTRNYICDWGVVFFWYRDILSVVWDWDIVSIWLSFGIGILHHLFGVGYCVIWDWDIASFGIGILCHLGFCVIWDLNTVLFGIL